MLRGLGQHLQQHRNLAECWAPFARQALSEAGMLEELDLDISSWTADTNNDDKIA